MKKIPLKDAYFSYFFGILPACSAQKAHYQAPITPYLISHYTKQYWKAFDTTNQNFKFWKFL